MNKEPETYDELILQRRCVELTKYYELSKEEVEKIYEWVKGNGTLKGGATGVSLYKGDILKDTILTRKTVSIDGLLLTKESLKVLMSSLKKIIHQDKECNFLIYHDKDRYRFIRYKV